MANAPAPQQLAPGSLYGLPGMDNPSFQQETNTGITTTLSQGNSVPVTGIVPFTDSDVVLGWDMEVTVSPVNTVGTGALTVSDYGPYPYVQGLKLQIQKAYSLLDVPSGIDAMLFHLFHPARRTSSRNALLSNPETLTALPAAGMSPNLNALTTSFAAADASVPFTIGLDAGLDLDVYYDLDQSGNILSPGHRRFVSPQFMSTARRVTPQIQMAALLAATMDQGAVNGTTGSSATGSVEFNFFRHAIYATSSLANLPPVANWQLQRTAQQVTIGAQTKVSIPLTDINGQICLVYVRLFDPGSGTFGAPISLSTISECDLKLGSGLYRYQDTPRSMQRRVIEQHNTLLPNGIVAWDLLTDRFGCRVNGDNLINTYTTGGVNINLTFATAPSASAYAVVGVEYLTYVQVGV